MKRAFTLIELLVYMAIMGFIIVVAGRVFSDSTVMRVRSQNMIKSSEEIGRISSLIKEDVSQMGAKVYGQVEAGNYKIYAEPEVYIAPEPDADDELPDSSSYMLFKGKNGPGRDSLVFRKMATESVREIYWVLRNDTIFRGCKTISGTENLTECPENPILMGKNVTKLEFFPSKPGVLLEGPSSVAPDTLFSTSVSKEFGLKHKPEDPTGNVVKLFVTNNGNVSTVSPSDSAYNSDGSKKKHGVLCFATKTGACMSFELIRGETYAIEFEMPFETGNASDSNSTQFLPGEDHLAVGLRDTTFGTIANAPPDVLIYPPQTIDRTGGKKHIEISPQRTIPSASVVLTIAFYSTKVLNGRLRFKDFRVFRKSDKAFHFPRGSYGTEDADANEKYKQKKNVKAFEMILEIDNRGERAGTFGQNGNGMMILTPNNGISTVGSKPQEGE